MKREWTSTVNFVYENDENDIPTIPHPPEGEGWRLVCAIRDNLKEEAQGVVWYWKREVE